MWSPRSLNTAGGVLEDRSNVLPASPRSSGQGDNLLADKLAHLSVDNSLSHSHLQTPKQGSPIPPSHGGSLSPLTSFGRPSPSDSSPITDAHRTPSSDDLTPVMHTVSSPNPKIHTRLPRVSSLSATISTDSMSPHTSPTAECPTKELDSPVIEEVDSAPLPYFHQQIEQPKRRRRSQAVKSTIQSDTSTSPVYNGSDRAQKALSFNPAELPRGSSLLAVDGGNYNSGHVRASSAYLSPPSPSASPLGRPRGGSATKDARPTSYVDLLNIPYHQQTAPMPNLDNSFLKTIVGNNASLLNTKRTLEMYYANVKKTADSSVQYEFAVFLTNAARDLPSDPVVRKESKPGVEKDEETPSRSDLLRKARQILESLSTRQYPFAQYYLGDGYASGLFNKDKPDWDKAFPLFVAASKHGHAESGYRAGLCYEFGWGSRRDYAKAVQFYRVSASRGHPGAATRLGLACLNGGLGIVDGRREGLKWLKRAHEMADRQYNVAPYELGLLHEVGYDDVFKDDKYAAQLFTQAAELGHPEAALKMGEAYEHGLLSCPRDPSLSLHFYTCAAQAGVPEAMLALCAWYLVGAPPVLPVDEAEAYAWAKRAAEYDYPKAQYTVGYFTERGIGCRPDQLEANIWYVKAADGGDEYAKQRLETIRLNALSDPMLQPVRQTGPQSSPGAKGKGTGRKGLKGTVAAAAAAGSKGGTDAGVGALGARQQIASVDSLATTAGAGSGAGLGASPDGRVRTGQLSGGSSDASLSARESPTDETKRERRGFFSRLARSAS